MKNVNWIYRFAGLNHLLIALFLFVSPLAGAYAACCTGHGGVASCKKGHQMCKDGTASPSCTCAMPKATKKTVVKTSPATVTTKSTSTKTVPVKAKSTTKATTTTTPKSSWWGGKTTATPASTSGASSKGCCSRHGGVAQCNKSSGQQMCKDGTSSPKCTCH